MHNKALDRGASEKLLFKGVRGVNRVRTLILYNLAIGMSELLSVISASLAVQDLNSPTTQS